MKKYLILIVAVFLMVGCPDTERYKAQQEEARALQMAEQARMVQAEQNAAMMRTLADAAKPNYWPMLAVAVLGFGGIMLVVRWHMVTVSHVAAGQTVRANDLRLLPGQVDFGQMKRLARRDGYELEVEQGAYFLVDNDGNRQRIKALIGSGNGG